MVLGLNPERLFNMGAPKEHPQGFNWGQINQTNQTDNNLLFYQRPALKEIQMTDRAPSTR